MMLPKVLQPRPARLLMVLGGVTATLLITAFIYLAPALGFQFIDFPRLGGGIFTADAHAAFWLGYVILFLMSAFVLPIVITSLWSTLPGHPLTVKGSLFKGLSAGALLWIVSGLVLPAAGALSPLVSNPGFFALSLGWPTVIGLLLGHLAYGLTVAMVGGMSGGTRPMDSLGWTAFGYGDVREAALQHPTRKAYGKLGRSA